MRVTFSTFRYVLMAHPLLTE